jgi:predicted O-linked N-acetylglucosamine transferase (SPINDLY family)
MSSVMERLKKSVDLHRAGRLDEAEHLYRDIVRVDPGHADALHLLGVIAHQRQDYDTAIESISRAITVRPRAALFHCNLGASLREVKEPQKAIDSFREAIRLDSELAEAHYNLALALRGQRQFAEAVIVGRRSVELDPLNAVALHNLGIIYNALEQRDEALDCFLKAIDLEPDNCAARSDAGATLLSFGKLDEAISHLEYALSIDPQFSKARSWLGRALHDAGRLQEAAAHLQQAVVDDPDNTLTHMNMGNAFISTRQLEKALVCFQRIVDLAPEELAGWTNLANVLKTQHKCEEATTAYRQVLRLSPDQPLGDLWLATLCPLVYQSNNEIDAYRSQLSADLARLTAMELRLDLSHFDARASVPPSNLQFQGRNNRPLLEQFASVFRHSFNHDPLPRRTKKPKLGIVVTSGHEGVFARSQGRMLELLQTDEFDVILICSPTGTEALRANINRDSLSYITISRRTEEAAATIREAEFDVLYFWETGSDVLNYFLPFCRLAPVQCVGPGNSGTSGIPSMDFFLSPAAEEPEDADEHYTETLLRMRTLESYQKRVTLPENPKQRADFGFTASQNLYVCSQKIQKVHPDFDQVLANILRKDGHGIVVLVQDKAGVAAEMLRQRFAVTIGDVADRIRFLPRLNFDDYCSLTAIADVLLDPIHYGGGMTLYDWASFNKPLVTWPSKFLRGRYAVGFYAKMGIDSCMVKSLDDYVDIAVAIGTDALYRSGIEAEIRAASDVIFEDMAIVKEHQRVFEMLIEQSRAGS